jgi:hypothetical protein
VLKAEFPKNRLANEIRAKGHHYPINTIKLSIEKIIRGCGSLRGVEKDWKLELKEEEKTTPCYSSIREWLGRVGLFELKREKEKIED